jgi:NAD(P)-dependent dehydrogenase (short-subunit alcohol dehydrogenase family)
MSTNKSVLITGATRGLGRHMANHFAARGYRLALTGRNPEELERVAAELDGQAGEIALETLDVTDYGAVAEVIGRCASRLGGLDIIVANAGVAFSAPAGKGHFELMRQTIDINLSGAIATAEAAIELFRRQGHGQLVGISSIAGVRGMRGQGAYCATKAGFSRYLEAARVETRREPIVITELAPGYIDTELNRSIPNRPFLVTAEKGTEIMVDLIERQVSFRYVPPWPWTLVAQALKWLPDSMIAKM